MHLIYYGHGLLDLHGLSTLATVVLGSGALYGFLRLIADVARLVGVTAGPIRPVWPPRTPPPDPPDERR